jgi:hypothetical protein
LLRCCVFSKEGKGNGETSAEVSLQQAAQLRLRLDDVQFQLRPLLPGVVCLARLVVSTRAVRLADVVHAASRYGVPRRQLVLL